MRGYQKQADGSWRPLAPAEQGALQNPVEALRRVQETLDLTRMLLEAQVRILDATWASEKLDAQISRSTLISRDALLEAICQIRLALNPS